MSALDGSADKSDVDWQELSGLYRIAPPGDKSPADLERSFSNSLLMTVTR